MKRLNQTFLSILLLLFGVLSEISAQSNRSGISYQAVAVDISAADGFGRNSTGEILSNRDINVRFIIREGSPDGIQVFEEFHETKTDPFGIFRLIVGGGGYNQALNKLQDLDWTNKAYYLEVSMDLDDGAGFIVLGTELLVVPPYALDGDDQTLSLSGNELSISGGNTIRLDEIDTDNELNTNVGLSGTILQITDAGGTKAVDLGTILGEDALAGDEIQDLSLSNDQLSITKNPAPSLIDLSPYLDNTDTQLTEAEVDAYVSNNGYLTEEIDGSISNELQTISRINDEVTLSDGGGSFSITDDDADPENEFQDLTLTGTTLSISDDPDGDDVDLSGLVGPFVLDAVTSTIMNRNPENENFLFGQTELNWDGDFGNWSRPMMYFNRNTGAVRIGTAAFNVWDDTNQGEHSVAIGLGGSAIGSNSLVLGHNSNAFGIGSVAIGGGNATAGRAVAIGGTASGEFSRSFGINIQAFSAYETVLGSYNTQVIGDEANWIPTDQLFVIGNGQFGPDIRSDALVMLKNGNTILNGSLTIDADNVGGSDGYTLPLQDGIANQILTTAGDGTTSWQSSTGDSPFNLNAGVISNKNPDDEDFVFGSTQLDDIAGTDDDNRMFFDKSTGAFRVGGVLADEWNETNRGEYSVAMGRQSSAAGSHSIAIGANALSEGDHSIALSTTSAIAFGDLSISIGTGQATGDYAIAIGSDPTAGGERAVAIGNSIVNGFGAISIGDANLNPADYSISLGSSNILNGHTSFTFGHGNQTHGFNSMSVGHRINTQSAYEIGLGTYNSNYSPISINSYDENDRLFVVGNGSGDSDRSDALVMLKNGNTTLNGTFTIDGDNVGGDPAYTLPAQDGDENQVMVTDGAGVVSWEDPSQSPFVLDEATNIIHNRNEGDEDFVFGSPQLDDDGDTDHDSRMFFDKSNGAFRAGNVYGTKWDQVNRGIYSVAFGYNTEASGQYSFASGASSTAEGAYSIAMGNVASGLAIGTIALGSGSLADEQNSIAIGWNAEAHGYSSLALGSNAHANYNYSTAIGHNANANNSSAVAIGSNALADGQYSFAAGNYTEALGYGSVALGRYTDASSSYSFAAGYSSDATGIGSVALGYRTQTGGNYSFASGYYANASGISSLSIGYLNIASGSTSVSLGRHNRARSYGETAIGLYNTDYTPANDIGFVDSDRLFVIGNGLDNSNRSDALVMLKNGNTTLNGQLTIDGDNIGGPGDPYTLPAQDGNANQVMVTDGAGEVSWEDQSMSPFVLDEATNIIHNRNETDAGFVFGSTSLDDLPGFEDNSRMFFHKSLSAFRAGTTASFPDRWNSTSVANVGWASIALGRDPIASGTESIALGAFASAIGDESVAIGTYSNAAAPGSVAIGTGTDATGRRAKAFGTHVIAPSRDEIAIGRYNTTYTLTMDGQEEFNATDRLFTIGNGFNGGSRSDALIILKNGTTTLNGTLTIDGDNVGGLGGYTLPGQRGSASQLMITDGAGLVNWFDLNDVPGTSDQRLKKEIQPLEQSLAKITDLEGVNFKWNEKSNRDTLDQKVGFIAQQVEEVLPELVSEGEDGYKRVNYIEVIPYLVEAIKELKQENEKLKVSNADTAKLQSRLDRIEQLLGISTGKTKAKKVQAE